jgi:hypothetical protein
LFPVVVGDRWGYVDASGNMVVNPQFEQAEFFSGGMANVRLAKKWGYVDTSGKLVINPQFEKAGTFVDGLALVEFGGRAGFIGPDGLYVVNPQFDAAGPFAEGRAAIASHASGAISTRRERPLSTRSSRMRLPFPKAWLRSAGKRFRPLTPRQSHNRIRHRQTIL